MAAADGIRRLKSGGTEGPGEEIQDDGPSQANKIRETVCWASQAVMQRSALGGTAGMKRSRQKEE